MDDNLLKAFIELLLKTFDLEMSIKYKDNYLDAINIFPEFYTIFRDPIFTVQCPKKVNLFTLRRLMKLNEGKYIFTTLLDPELYNDIMNELDRKLKPNSMTFEERYGL